MELVLVDNVWLNIFGGIFLVEKVWWKLFVGKFGGKIGRKCHIWYP